MFDEATRGREDAWIALRSTLTATRGAVRIIGNVKGRKNWVYRLARQAEDGDDPESHYARITAWDAVEAGVLDRDEIDRAKRDLPEKIFRELYLAEPSDDGGNPFGLSAIQNCIVEDLADGPVHVWGVDLAKSQDWTVAIGLNRDGGVCAFQRWQSDWRNTRHRLKAMLADGNAALVDSTGVGDPIVEDLARVLPQVEGYNFSGWRKKQQLMEGLAVAIQNRRVTFPEGRIVRELEIFEYQTTRTNVTYSAPSGYHDDCVCALALAVHAYEFSPSARNTIDRVRLATPDQPNAWDGDEWMDIDNEAIWRP